ncbi:hypothetical protein OXX69_004416 [Metschnikowia pulcherrima]
MSYLPIGKDDGNHNVVGNPDMELREQDRWLPIANVARLMKSTLPMSAKVSKDAKECMQECVSEFISFITSEASDKCLREKRKTINGEDVLYSLHDLGFENYAEVLKIYLAKYREQQALKQERGEVRPSKKQYKKRKSSEDPDSESVGNVVHEDIHEGAPIGSLAYSESPQEKIVPSPDYFQHYGANEANGHELAPDQDTHGVHIKTDVDVHHDIVSHEKNSPTYPYNEFINGEEIAKEDVSPGAKSGDMAPLDSAERASDLDHLETETSDRTYY